jgi:hypothetical protein
MINAASILKSPIFYGASAGVDAAIVMTPCLNSEQTKEERYG